MKDFPAFNRENYDKIAPLYDTFLDISFDHETNWYSVVEKYFAELGTMNNKIIDIGCATGTFGIFLGNIGYDVTGFDFSSNMLIVARNKLRQYNATVAEHRQMFLKHPYMVSDPNAKVQLSKIKPVVKFIQGDILDITTIRETYGSATMFDTLSNIEPADVEKAFSNVAKCLVPGGLFGSLFSTEILFAQCIGSGFIEKEHMDYNMETKAVDGLEGVKALRRTVNFKAGKALVESVDVEFTEYYYSLRDIVALYEKTGFQIQKIICDTHIYSGNETDVSEICDAIEKSYALANGVRRILVIGRKK